MSRLCRCFHFASRCHGSTDALYSLCNFATSLLISICFTTSRRRRSQLASRCRDSPNRVERSFASRFHRPSLFASRLRDFATPSAFSIRFTISQLRRHPQFALRLRDSVGALNSFLNLLREFATPLTLSICSRLHDSSNTIQHCRRNSRKIE